LVSGLVKEWRRGRERQALAFAVELSESGFERHVWKRAVIFCAEDVGLANPALATEVWALHEMAEWLKKVRKDDPSRPWRLHLVMAVLLCARSPKSRICDNALMAYYAGGPVIPVIEDYHLDRHTTRGSKKGRSYKHFFEVGALLADQEGELGYGDLVDDYRADAIKAVGGKGKDRVVSTLTQGGE
jgi:replication-associated recombination protein RarA